MPIENRTLTAGTSLVARYKKADRMCEVVQTADGLRYRLDDGTEHRSPSSAGKVAMGGVACNGWRFWSLQGTESARKTKTDKPAKAKMEPAPRKATKAAPKKSAKTKSAKTGSRRRATHRTAAASVPQPS